MPNLGYPVNTLVVTVASPVNASANVTLANVNVNVSGNADYSSMAETILLKGFWNGTQFIPGSRITLITALGT